MRFPTKRILSGLAAAACLVVGQAQAQNPQPTYATVTPVVTSGHMGGRSISVIQPAAQPLPAQPMPAAPAHGTGKAVVVTNTPFALDCCPPVCCDTHSRLSIFGDYLFMSARDVDIAYAQPIDGAAFLSVPTGPLGIVSPEYESAWRLGLGWEISKDASVQLSFLMFESQTEDSIGIPPGVLLQGLLVHPNTTNASPDSLNAQANYDIDLDVLDMDYKAVIRRGCNYTVSALLGVRYSRLQQDLLVQYTILGGTTVTTNVEFDGVGPRLGLDGEYRLAHGWYVYGQGAASVLIGDFTADFVQQNVFAGTQAQTAYENARLVPVTNLELGLGWMSHSGCVRVMVGYTLQGWFNAVNTGGFINAVQAGNANGAGAVTNGNYSTNGDNLRDNITFDGLLTRVEFRF